MFHFFIVLCVFVVFLFCYLWLLLNRHLLLLHSHKPGGRLKVKG